MEYEALFTERAGHAEEMVVKWAEDFDVVVSVSGDGTTNEIINGIMIFEERKRYFVRFDYEDQTFEDWVLISILCNAPLFGRYIRIHPEAKMNDGLLGLTIGREMPNVYGLVLFLFACLGGRHGFSRKVSYHQVRKMRVECKTDTYAQIDGEVYKFDAGRVIELSVVPGALRVLVPPESLRNRKLPFVPREEPPEPLQLRLMPRREGVAEDLEALSKRVKARVERALEITRARRRLMSAIGRPTGRQQVFDFEREEMKLVRRAAKILRKELGEKK